MTTSEERAERPEAPYSTHWRPLAFFLASCFLSKSYKNQKATFYEDGDGSTQIDIRLWLSTGGSVNHKSLLNKHFSVSKKTLYVGWMTVKWASHRGASGKTFTSRGLHSVSPLRVSVMNLWFIHSLHFFCHYSHSSAAAHPTLLSVPIIRTLYKLDCGIHSVQ